MHNFKPGDWVVEIHSEEIHKIIELFPDVCRVIKPISKIIYSTEYTDFKPWHPQPNEWCWFYDSFNPQVTPVLAQFDYMSDNVYVTKAIELPLSGEGPYPYGFNSCIPFIGILPDIPKDN